MGDATKHFLKPSNVAGLQQSCYACCYTNKTKGCGGRENQPTDERPPVESWSIGLLVDDTREERRPSPRPFVQTKLDVRYVPTTKPNTSVRASTRLSLSRIRYSTVQYRTTPRDTKFQSSIRLLQDEEDAKIKRCVIRKTRDETVPTPHYRSAPLPFLLPRNRTLMVNRSRSRGILRPDLRHVWRTRSRALPTCASPSWLSLHLRVTSLLTRAPSTPHSSMLKAIDASWEKTTLCVLATASLLASPCRSSHRLLCGTHEHVDENSQARGYIYIYCCESCRFHTRQQKQKGSPSKQPERNTETVGGTLGGAVSRAGSIQNSKRHLQVFERTTPELTSGPRTGISVAAKHTQRARENHAFRL